MRMECVICGEPGKWRYSPDLDIEGISSCDVHKSEVFLAYTALILGDEKTYNSFIKSSRNKYNKNKLITKEIPSEIRVIPEFPEKPQEI
jgi:hypothetical protein